MAMIDKAPRSATAIAKTDCRRFEFMVSETPFFALHVMRVLVDRLRRTTNALWALSAAKVVRA
jgi:CRP/FNR family transcriptional regulator, cyclic AMP receptor protein